MNNIYNYCESCRICKNTELIDVIDLNEQFITSRFPNYGDNSTPKTPILLCLCKECSLVQLRYSTNCSELYEYEYGYRSGINDTMRQHLKSYKEEIESIVELKKGDYIIDIGSNDSTMLQYYDEDYKRIGVDPTGNQFKDYYGNVELISNYFTLNNIKNVYGNIKCKVISSISMFYDLPSPIKFARDIYELLDDDGIWTCEQSYLLEMLKKNSIDTICHEHLEYYSFTAIKYIADLVNFKIIDVKFNDCNGGSFRIYFSKRKSNKYTEKCELIDKILDEENKMGIKDEQLYFDFVKKCDFEVNKLKNLINVINENKRKIYIYGASTKGNCLLQYANIRSKDIKYAVERNHNKIGKMTSTGIEIISEESMRERPPEYLLILPWHFKEEIINREKDYIENGGQLVFPFPQLEIYSKKPKVIITGCDGLISKYLINDLFKNYTLYGICNRNEISIDNNIIKYNFNVNNYENLKNMILSIEPQTIIHLAGISNSLYAFNNVIETLNINGIVTSYICDIIYKFNKNIKLFNASSSEIYKGHVDYIVKEDDSNMFHIHPYSIGKILSHTIIQFYRNNFGLCFTNGIIFTAESTHKSDNFLLNKLSKHISTWKNDKKPITIGSLQSYRNIIHVSDVSKAIKMIIDEKKGNDYLICHSEGEKNSFLVYELVQKLFKYADIELINDNDIIYDKFSKEPIIIIENKNIGLDTQPTNIRGLPSKLINMGWKSEYNIDDILFEIYKKYN
jgi:GDP-D-mannose dehydratase